MISEDLSSILEPAPGVPDAFRYKSLPIAEKPSTCDLPAFDSRTINTSYSPPPAIDKQCLTLFIPAPLVPPPYIPIDDISNPCPSGFVFETLSAAISGSTISSVGTAVTGTSTAFSKQIPAGFSMPEIIAPVSKTITAINVDDSGSGYSTTPTIIIDPPTNPIISSGGIQAVASAIMGSGGTTVDSIVIVDPGYGYLSIPSVTFSTGNAVVSATVGISNLKRRVLSVPPGDDTHLTLRQPFPVNLSASTYSINHLVIGADTTLPTDGAISFYEFGVGDPSPSCGGYFIGDININPVDINVHVPCPGGMTFTNNITVQDNNLVDQQVIGFGTGDNCNFSLGDAEGAPITITIPKVKCTDGIPTLTTGSGMTLRTYHSDGTHTDTTPSLSMSDTDTCAPTINLPNIVIPVPFCSGGLSVTGGGTVNINIPDYSSSPPTMVPTAITLGSTPGSCSFALSIPTIDISIPPLLPSPYFSFSPSGSGVIINLKNEGPSITDTDLYKAIRDALQSDSQNVPCQGCAVWA